MITRYYLTTPGTPEVEVTKAEYVRAERAAGFHNTLGQPEEPATAAFGTAKISGRTDWGSGDGHTT